jgi:iron complex outermembrane receptor protein
MIQAFSEERHLRRDGVELLGYGTIAEGSAIATSNPDLAGVQLSEPDRRRLLRPEARADRRPGGRPAPTDRPVVAGFPVLHVGSRRDELQPQLPVLGVQCAPGRRGAGSRSWLRSPQRHAGLGVVFGAGGPSAGVFDQISRPNEKATSNYGAFNASYAVSDALTISGESARPRVTARRPRRTFPRLCSRPASAGPMSCTARAAGRASTSAPPTPRRPSPAALPSASAGFSATRMST